MAAVSLRQPNRLFQPFIRPRGVGALWAAMSNGYRTLSQHLNDLKKENFSLKLRIYFLEERIQQKYEESCEDVYRTVSPRLSISTAVGFELYVLYA